MSRFSRCALVSLWLVTSSLFWHSTGYGQASTDLPIEDPAKVIQQDSAGRSPLEQRERQVILVRLPRYFAGIVDQQQRLVIQEIQLRYRNQIEAMEKELEQLRGQQVREMEAVLTESQLKLLNQKREQARMVRSVPRMERDGETDQNLMRDESPTP